jgi:hypothetical protein
VSGIHHLQRLEDLRAQVHVERLTEDLLHHPSEYARGGAVGPLGAGVGEQRRIGYSKHRFGSQEARDDAAHDAQYRCQQLRIRGKQDAQQDQKPQRPLPDQRSFTENAGQRGIQVTSSTISAESERYVTELIQRQRLPCRMRNEDFCRHTTSVPYDAIVILGVLEHLPDYPAVLRLYQKLLKTGGGSTWTPARTARSTPNRPSSPATSFRVTTRTSVCMSSLRRWPGSRWTCWRFTTIATTTFSRALHGPRSWKPHATRSSTVVVHRCIGASGSISGGRPMPS